MNIVALEDKICLLLDMRWLPHSILNARATSEYLVRDKLDLLDKNNLVVKSFADWLEEPTEYYHDQPCIRTIKKEIPLPTIAIMNNKFIKNHTVKKSISFNRLCSYFDNTCQSCYNKFQKKYLTIEHIYPRAKGGSNDDFNITLTCKRCNSTKADRLDYEDINGKPLEGITATDYFKMKFNVQNARKEWEAFYIKAK